MLAAGRVKDAEGVRPPFSRCEFPYLLIIDR